MFSFCPHVCGPTTIGRGLCVDDPADCHRRVQGSRPVPPTPVDVQGKKYAYVEEFLGRQCYFDEASLKVDYDEEHKDGEAVPANFSCLTYNIWGLANSEKHRHLFTLRQPLLEKTIRESGADLLCLQEMSEFAYERLDTLLSEYPFASEVPYPASAAIRNRSVDTYFLSKYKPVRVTMYGLPGVLGYENCLLVIEYLNLVVFNLYNQAGSKHSPGQQHKWIHYSRCRFDILQTIHDMIQRRYRDKSTLICGDFNFHLDGSREDWPEVEMLDRLKALGFQDTFRIANPTDPGFTEDTDFSHMRWNQKLLDKHLRYDGILYRSVAPAWSIRSSKLIGTDYVCLSKDDSAWFIENMSDVKADEIHRLAQCASPKSREKRIPINASDHLGVLTVFGPVTGGRRKTRSRIHRTRLTHKR
jgi:exonuclease III